MPSTEAEPPRQSRSEVRGYILFTFAVAIALAIAWHIRTTLVLIYVSALFSVVLLPVVQWIMDFEMRGGRRISRGIAITLLLSCVALGLTIFFVVGLPPVIHDIRQFAADLPYRINQLVTKLNRLPIAKHLGIDSIASRAENALSTTAEFLVSSFPKWMSRIFDLLTGFILCVYFMLEGEYAYGWFLSLFPEPTRKRLDTTLQRAEVRISKWLLGQGLLMLILGVSSTITFGFLHVRYFFLLGVLMGLMNIIPIAGGIISILIVGGVAALDSWARMGGVFIFYAIYVNVENAYLTPRIMRSSVNLMGLTVLIALIAGTEIAGIIGALVAVPTAALIAVLVDEYVIQTQPSTDNLVKAAKAVGENLPH